MGSRLALLASATDVAGERDHSTAADQRVEHGTRRVAIAEWESGQHHSPEAGRLKLSRRVPGSNRGRRLPDPKVVDRAKARASRGKALRPTNGGCAGRPSRSGRAEVLERDPQLYPAPFDATRPACELAAARLPKRADGSGQTRVAGGLERPNPRDVVVARDDGDGAADGRGRRRWWRRYRRVRRARGRRRWYRYRRRRSDSLSRWRRSSRWRRRVSTASRAGTRQALAIDPVAVAVDRVRRRLGLSLVGELRAGRG